MNGLDIAIAIAATAAFVGGYRRGLLARLTVWVFVIGTVLAVADNMNSVVKLVHRGQGKPRPFQIVMVIVGAIAVGRIVGGVVGYWVKRRIPTRPLRAVDRLAGGSVGLAGVAITLWLATPVLAFIPGWPSGAVRKSAVATTLAQKVPIQLNALSAVRNLLADGGFPVAVSEIARSVDAGKPPANPVLSESKRVEVRDSVVKVSSVGCSGESIGSGFFVGAKQVLTAAHVVAGGTAISVETDEGITPASIVAFDSVKDLALLKVEGRGGAALRILDGSSEPEPEPESEADTASERLGEAFGFRDGGPLKIRTLTSSKPLQETGRDIYDERVSVRQVLRLAADLGPGDSGAPVVDAAGRVLGLVFSRAPDRSTTAFALSAEEIRTFLASSPTLGSGLSPRRCIA
jgi:S1-C subfamily serine protease